MLTRSLSDKTGCLFLHWKSLVRGAGYFTFGTCLQCNSPAWTPLLFAIHIPVLTRKPQTYLWTFIIPHGNRLHIIPCGNCIQLHEVYFFQGTSHIYCCLHYLDHYTVNSTGTDSIDTQHWRIYNSQDPIHTSPSQLSILHRGHTYTSYNSYVSLSYLFIIIVFQNSATLYCEILYILQ